MFIYSCSDEKEEAKFVSAKLSFNHIFNNDLMLFNDRIFTNEAGNDLIISKVRYILSDFKLTKSNGQVVEFDSLYCYIDASKNLTSLDLPEIESGNYKNISFMIGVDSAMNHRDPSLLEASHPLSLINHNLHWGWIDGYIFFSIEGYLTYQGQTQTFTYHLGLDKSKRTISIDGDIQLTDNAQINIDFDVASLFKTPNLIDQSQEVYITHSTNDNNLSERLMDNLLDAFKIQGVLH